MALYLKVYEQDQLIKTQLIESERLEIGRAEGAEIHFNSPEISRNHARLILKPQALDDEDMNEGIADLIDAGSRYGVWVHNEQVWYHALSTEELFRISENLSLCLSRQADLSSLVIQDEMQNNEEHKNNENYLLSLERDTEQFSVVNNTELAQLIASQSVADAEVSPESEAQVEESVFQVEESVSQVEDSVSQVEESVQPTLETKREIAFELEAGQTVEAEIELSIEVAAEPIEEPVIEVEVEPAVEPVAEVAAEPIAEPVIEVEAEPAVEPVIEVEAEPLVESGDSILETKEFAEQIAPEAKSSPEIRVESEANMALAVPVDDETQGQGMAEPRVFRPILWSIYQEYLTTICKDITQVQADLPIGTESQAKLNQSLNEMKSLITLLTPELIRFDEALVKARQSVAPLTPADFALHINNQCGELMVNQSFIEAFKIAFFALIDADEVDWLHIDFYYENKQIVVQSDPPLAQYLDQSIWTHQVALTILGL